MLKKISLLMIGLALSTVMVFNFQSAFDPTVKDIDFGIQSLFNVAHAQIECEPCISSPGDQCNYWFWCNFCGPNGESYMEYGYFVDYENYCMN